MPRKLLQRFDSLPYHVTARANNREVFPLELDRVWRILANEAYFVSLTRGAEIQAIVLMPNHFHMILTVPEQDLGVVMCEFMRSASRTLNLQAGRTGHVFGGPYHWSLIKERRYFSHALKYVYRNPVRANLCERVEQYPYSSLHGLVGRSALPFPVFRTRVGMESEVNFVDQLEWLNVPLPSEAEALIRKGLRRRVFDTIIDRRTRMPHSALSGHL